MKRYSKKLYLLFSAFSSIISSCNKNEYVKFEETENACYIGYIDVINNFKKVYKDNEDIYVESFISCDFNFDYIPGRIFDLRFEIVVVSERRLFQDAYEPYLVYEINDLDGDYYKTMQHVDFIIPRELLKNEKDTLYLDYVQNLRNDWYIGISSFQISYKKKNGKIIFYDYIGPK